MQRVTFLLLSTPSFLMKYFAEACGLLAHYTFVDLLYSFISSRLSALPRIFHCSCFLCSLTQEQKHHLQSDATLDIEPSRPLEDVKKPERLGPGRRLGVWHQIKHGADERVRRANYDIAPRCQNISRSEGEKAPKRSGPRG